MGTTPVLLFIDNQLVRLVPFNHLSKGVDGNKKVKGRKRQVLTDSPGLIWGVVVGAANEADDTVARKVVESLLGYMDRMKKILADYAYICTHEVK